MLTDCIIVLNRLAGGIAAFVLAPIEWMPGWVSSTLFGAVTGLLMLLVYKHTSNQSAIKRTRDQIKSNLLALSIFRDNLRVGFKCQGAILLGAGRLLVLSIVPILVMSLPMTLLLGQLALWYQARPLKVGETTVATVHLSGAFDRSLPDAQLEPTPAVSVVAGPVQVASRKMVCWNLEIHQPGTHELKFQIGSETVTKELVVAQGFKPTSMKRPCRDLSDLFMHPHETPFAGNSLVQSIELVYPERTSYTSGTNWWIGYWFLVSLIAAFAAKPILKVQL